MNLRAQPRLTHDRAGEIGPTDMWRPRKMIRPALLSADHSARHNHEGSGNIPSRCRPADLIFDHVQTLACLAQPQHRLDEVITMFGKHPGRAQDGM